MEPLCCSLHKALNLDPVPVIGDALYVPGAEGFILSDLTQEIVTPCPSHRYSLKHTVGLLVQHASRNKLCSCESSHPAPRTNGEDEPSVSPFVPNGAGKVGRKSRGRGGERGGERGREQGGNNSGGSGSIRRTLWAYDVENVVTAYRWLWQNRSRLYPQCCNAVIVYQLKKSQSLPPGLYVYRTPPPHFGCTAERPLTVVDQFNFGSQDPFGSAQGLPSSIAIKMFPGRENFSALYVINRKLDITVPEYGNRLFGEARALGLIEPCSTINAIACKHHEVAMRTDQKCVIDLRWRGFDTKTACIKAIPRVRGLQAVVWSNHNGKTKEIECEVLTWLLGLFNELPKEVQLIDYTQEKLGVRYILIEMETFPGVLPKPPSTSVCFFIHTHFIGDVKLATQAIGEVLGTRRRMGSPCPDGATFTLWYSLPSMGYVSDPTPFSCGVRDERVARITEDFKESLSTWAPERNGTSCLALAVQHTLYYHPGEKRYKMMVSHTVMDSDTTLSIFKL